MILILQIVAFILLAAAGSVSIILMMFQAVKYQLRLISFLDAVSLPVMLIQIIFFKMLVILGSAFFQTTFNSLVTYLFAVGMTLVVQALVFLLSRPFRRLFVQAFEMRIEAIAGSRDPLALRVRDGYVKMLALKPDEANLLGKEEEK